MPKIELSRLDDERFERIFQAYVLANKAHWQTPPVEMVVKKILNQGFYLYTAGQPDNWSTKLSFSLDKDIVKIEVIINPKMPEGMKKLAENIKEEAENRIDVIV